MSNTIQSGTVETGLITPTGTKKMLAVDSSYVTKDEFVNYSYATGLGITSSSTIYSSGELDRILLRASGEVNRICRRFFDTQTIDETKTGFRAQPFNPQLTTVVLKNRPYRKVNSIYIQVLKWFIQVDTTSANSYLQEFPDLGYYKIVPLLSSSGGGVGSPIPAAILDKVALGVLWTNYTFGYGTTITSETLTQPTGTTDLKTYQAPIGLRLWAKSQTITVYKNSVLVSSSAYTVTDYANGIIKFNNVVLITDVITASYISNESVPFDIKEATMLLACHQIGQGGSNPLGMDSFSIQTYSANFGKGKLYEKAVEMLKPYVNRLPKII